MSKRIPQRDVNLAHKLLNVSVAATNVAMSLLDPTTTVLDEGWHRQMERALLSALNATSDHDRKVSPIELKGQRG